MCCKIELEHTSPNRTNNHPNFRELPQRPNIHGGNNAKIQFVQFTAEK